MISLCGDFGRFRKGLIEASAAPPHTDIATIRPARRSAQEGIIFVSEEAQMTRFFKAHHGGAAESGLVSPMSLAFDLKHLQCSVIPAAAAAGLFYLLAPPAFAQTDPGVRGGLQNTACYLQYRGIPIPHPPVISPNPTTGATIAPNALASSNAALNPPAQFH